MAMWVVTFSSTVVLAQAAEDVRDRVARWRSRFDGRHFVASVRLTYDFGGQRKEVRTLDVWRDDQGGQERLMARFEKPLDLRGFGLLYIEHEGRPNDYFVYQPATKRVRRIAASLAAEDVYGVDLEFLGFGFAQSEPSEVESIRKAEIDGRTVYRVTERALRRNQRFDRRFTYVAPDSLIPVRTEHERSGRIVLVATTEKIDEIQSVFTPMRTRFHRPEEDSDVVMEVTEIDYERAIPGAFFSTLALMK